MLKLKKPGANLPVFLLGLAAIGIAFVLTYHLVTRNRLKSSGLYICHLVYQKHILGREALFDWRQSCQEGLRQNSFPDTDTVATYLQGKFDEIPGSHLNLMSPVEETFMNFGRALHSGIWSVGVNGRFFVSRVHPESELAEKVSPGDEILKVNGRTPVVSSDVQSSGEHVYRLKSGEVLSVVIEGRELSIDSPPEIEELTSSTALLKIPSFRKDNFEKESWIETAKKIIPYKNIIVDLRGNRGGDFMALTRALSVIGCKIEDLGVLSSPQVDGVESYTIKDDPDDADLLAQVGRVKEIRLRRFEGYPCYEGRVQILQDARTGSVAEMFILNMRKLPSVSTHGQTTSGQVMLAVWYGVDSLGPGYNVSIPEALFQIDDGENYDRVGIHPQENLQILLEDAKAGRDSWLRQITGT